MIQRLFSACLLMGLLPIVATAAIERIIARAPDERVIALWSNHRVAIENVIARQPI